MNQKNMNQDISERLLELRLARKMSRKQLCTEAGINVAAYSRLENSKSDLRMSTILKLCSALDVSPNILLGWTEA